MYHIVYAQDMYIFDNFNIFFIHFKNRQIGILHIIWSKIIIALFLELNIMSHSTPFFWHSNRSLLSPRVDGDTKAMSSANNKWLINMSPIVHPILSLFNRVLRSSIYTLKKRGERMPPWRSPLLNVNGSDTSLPQRTHITVRRKASGRQLGFFMQIFWDEYLNEPQKIFWNFVEPFFGEKLVSFVNINQVPGT